MKNKKLYPLKFEPETRQRDWGTSDWAIWSLYGGSSTVTNGFLEENTLDDLLETYMGDFVGEQQFTYFRGMFPVMLSILNVGGSIPLHIHPDDKAAFDREDAFGKREFWYVLDAGDDATVYMGFNRDITAQELFDRIKSGTLEAVLNTVKPKRGDAFLIEPGWVHAASGRIRLAEISEASGAMYNLYKWQADPDVADASKSDIFEAIDLVQYEKHQLERGYVPAKSEGGILAQSESFVVKKTLLERTETVLPSSVNSFVIYLCISGGAKIRCNKGDEYEFASGEAILVPASLEEFKMEPTDKGTVLLECYMPEPPAEKDSYENGIS